MKKIDKYEEMPALSLRGVRCYRVNADQVDEINDAIDNAVEVYTSDNHLKLEKLIWTGHKNVYSKQQALIMFPKTVNPETAIALIDEILDSDKCGDIMAWEELHDKLRKARIILEREDD